MQELQLAHEANRGLDSENQQLRKELFLARKNSKQFEAAEQIYWETIYKLLENPASSPSAAELELRYEFAAMKMEQRQFATAEIDARYVYNQRIPKEQASEGLQDFKLSHRQLCLVLRSQALPQKREEAMMMHRNIWEEKRHEHDWRAENGDDLCLVYMDQKEYREAEITQKKVWEERKEKKGIRNEATMCSALRMISIWENQIISVNQGTQSRADKRVEKEYFENKTRDFVRNIWDFRKTPERNVKILAIGHRLGGIHFQRKEYAVATAIFDDVWTGRWTVLGEHHPDTLTSGHEFGVSAYHHTDYERARVVLEQTWRAKRLVLGKLSASTILSAYSLALIFRRLGEYDLAELLSRWIWERTKRISGEKSLSALGALYELGMDLHKQTNKYQEAETIFISIYQDSYTDPGQTDPDLEQLALKSGHALAITQSKQDGRVNDTINTIRDVFRAKQNAQKQDELTTMESGCLYGQCLIGRRNFTEAEAVLRPLWDLTSTPSLEAAQLQVGDFLGQCLAGLNRHHHARDILTEVMCRKRTKYGRDSAECRKTSPHLEDAKAKGQKRARRNSRVVGFH